jgi:3-hydroxybutyryl-CoA dehydrogenase
MKLTEVVKGEHCSDDTAEFLMEFSRKTGKTPILVKKECEGFVVNRAFRVFKDECYRIVEEGICSPQDCDLGLELGLGHPMGVFRLNDFTGINLTAQLNENRLKETGVKPPLYELVKEKYEKGEWGRSTGKGFYDYSDKK